MAALTLCVANLKGGTGKTTVTLNLASCFHKAGHRVLIVDADPQGSCTTWSSQRGDGPPVVAIQGQSLRRSLAQVSEGFEVVIIDSPPRMGIESRSAMLLSDLVIIPTLPGAADIWALQETLRVVEDARDLRPDLRVRVVLNRTDRTTLARLAREAIEELGTPILPATLGSRVAFGEATLAGLGVVDYQPGSVAALEIQALTQAVTEACQS